MADYAAVRRQIALRQAEGYLELGLPQRALDTLGQIERLPGSSRGHAAFLRGEALRALERYQEAIGPLSLASRDATDAVAARLALGWCYKRTGRLDLAIRELEAALRKEPADALIHYNLACYLSLARDRGQALRHLEQAFRLDPGYRRLVEQESDFDPLRDDPDFQSLVGAVA
jgi:tetratricopeptide (TPR) repeat protein